MTTTTRSATSIRVTLTQEEAEALLIDPHGGIVPVDPVVRLRARGKLIDRLLSQSGYVPPLERLRRSAAERDDFGAAS